MSETNTPKTISPEISTGGTLGVLSDIPAAAERVINPESIMMPSYIEQTDEGIFVIFEELKQPIDLQMSLDTWFRSNMYIEGFEVKEVEQMLFEGAPHKNRMKIGTALKAIPEDILQLFGGNIVTKNDGEGLWNFFYQPLILQRAFEGVEDTEKVQTLLDVLMAQAWKQNIRYGFQYGEVAKKLKDEFDKRKDMKQSAGKIPMIIAKPEKETTGEDASIVEVIPSKIPNGKDAINKKVRLDEGHVHQREVEIDEILYKKIPATPGKSGMDISGLPKPGISGKDIPFFYDLESITMTEGKDGILFLKAKVPGFLYQEKDGKVEIRPTITVQAVNIKITGGNIGVHQNAISVKDDITEDIDSALSIETGGGILGANVNADTWVKVKESVVGNSKAFTGNKGRTTIHEIGRIQAGEDITVGKNIENAYISSQTGAFQFGGYLTGSHVSAPRILGKKVVNSYVFGNSVTLEEADNCVIVANQVDIKKVGDNVSIVLILPDISGDIEQLEKEITKLGDGITKGKTVYIQALADGYKFLNIQSGNPGKFHELIAQLAPLFMKLDPTEEDTKRIKRFDNITIRRLIELFQKLEKLKQEKEEREKDLIYRERLPEITKQGVTVKLGTISDHVSLQEYAMPIEEDIHLKREDEQQQFAKKAQGLPWKQHKVQGSSFSLHGIK